MIKNNDHPNLLQFESFDQIESLFHFTTTVSGGISKDNYSSFNLGMYAGDDIECVSENRKRLSNMVGVDEDKLITPYQLHGNKVVAIDNDFLSKPDLEQSALLHGVDAIMTNQHRICIGITTADCVPILLFDPILKVLAAVHAGWRGTVAQIVEKTILEMKRKFGCNPNMIMAGIGPAISQKNFEVGNEVTEAFVEAGYMINNIGYQNQDTGKAHIDLCFANKLSLIRAGVPEKNIETANLCTYSNPDLFFSARRQGINSGRMVTGGVLFK